MNQRGLTIIELVIATALLSSALVGSAAVYASTTKTQLKGTSVRAVQQSTRYILDQISRDIRNAAAITSTGADEIKLANSKDVGGSVEYKYVSPGATGQIQRCPYDVNGAALPCTVIGDANTYVTAATFDYHEGTKLTPFVVINLNVSYGQGLVTTDPASFSYAISTVVSSRDR